MINVYFCSHFACFPLLFYHFSFFSFLQGVTLKQILTPGDPTNVDFEVVNDREANIEVTVDLEGEGAIDFKSHERPLKAVVLAKVRLFFDYVSKTDARE